VGMTQALALRAPARHAGGMSRTALFAPTMLVSILTLAAPKVDAADTPPTKPNLLVVLADPWRADAQSAAPGGSL